MDITVTYRRTSRLSIRIGRHGEVRVSVPYGLAKGKVEQFVEEHRAWIEKARQNTTDRLERRNDFFAQLPLTTKQECGEAAERMHALIPPLVERYSKLMGVRPSGIEYKATISRWGACNTRTRRIQFSVYLLLLPDWCIEHVVVHELAHLIVPNHGPRFYAVMDRFFPRWKEARVETKRISRMEES